MNYFSLWWPVALIVGADVVYQVCAKKLSTNASPLAALGLTYIVSAFLCAVLFEIVVPDGHIWQELQHVHIPAVIVGISIAGLEVGTIYMYRAGWQMNTGFLTYTACISVLLLFIGAFVYGEPLGWVKLAGVVLTLIGMGCIVK